MKAKAWLESARNLDDPFDRFSRLWRGFSNLYDRDVRASQRQRIDRHVTESLDESDARILLAETASAVDFLVERPVIDVRGNGHDTSEQCAQFRDTQSSVEKLSAIMLIAYSVRCNLEHGQKSPDRKRDRALCHNAAIIVEKYLTQIL